MKQSTTRKKREGYRDRVLVTGASGFIGTNLLNALAREKIALRALSRTYLTDSLEGLVDCMVIGDMATADCRRALEGVGAVVHLAARVHVMNDKSQSPLEEYRMVNVAGTLNLARQAAECGVRRFIFLSTVKVNGEETRKGKPFTETDLPNPSDPYAISKLEAEKALLALSKQTGMEVVIIRPPLVYGPGVKANFFRMIEWIYKGRPLPLGSVHNRRSLVAIDNLIDLIICCIEHPAAKNQVFFVSDGEDLSTTDLLRRLANALGTSAMLLPIPQHLLKMGFKMAGRNDLAKRLLGSLQVDISKVKRLLGWQPVISKDEGFRQIAEWFLGLEDHR